MRSQFRDRFRVFALVFSSSGARIPRMAADDRPVRANLSVLRMKPVISPGKSLIRKPHWQNESPDTGRSPFDTPVVISFCEGECCFCRPPRPSPPTAHPAARTPLLEEHAPPAPSGDIRFRAPRRHSSLPEENASHVSTSNNPNQKVSPDDHRAI